MSAQALVNMGYYGYQGWSDAAADADFAATHGAGKGGPASQSGGNPAQSVNAAIEDSFKRLMTETATRFSQYKTSHPFDLDQVLAQKTQEAHEQIDPYYEETLSNYLKGVTNKITRSKQDASDVLSELNADTRSYQQGNTLKLQTATLNAQQGFSNQGLFNSGARARAEGTLQTGANADLADYMRAKNAQTNQVQNNLSRTLEDTGLESTQRQRDIGRQQYTDVTQRAGDLSKEAGQQYVQGFNATLPPELQGANGFDALKSLGIFS